MRVAVTVGEAVKSKPPSSGLPSLGVVVSAGKRMRKEPLRTAEAVVKETVWVGLMGR